MVDKSRGRQVGNLYDVTFWEFVQHIKGVDIPFQGLPFTLTNKLIGNSHIWERLDKTICYP